MKKKIVSVIIIAMLFCGLSLFAEPYSSSRTIKAIITDIASRIDLSDKVFCDIGSDLGDVMIWASEYAEGVVGLEIDSSTSAKSRKRKDSKGNFLNVVTGDATIMASNDPNNPPSMWPDADVYYIWIGRVITSQIIEKIETEDIKAIFIIGCHTDYITNEFFKFRGMTPYTVKTWHGVFTYWIWDRR